MRQSMQKSLFGKQCIKSMENVENAKNQGRMQPLEWQ